MNEIRRITVLDCPIDSATMEQTVSRCVGWQHDPHRRPRTLITVNAAIVVNMRQDEPLRRAVEAGDLIVPDGMPVVWASRLLGKPLVERVAGVDLMARLLEVASQHHWRVFLLGALTVGVGRRGAFVGMAIGASVMLAVKSLTPVNWQWYVLIGSLTTFAAGVAASRLLDSSDA